VDSQAHRLSPSKNLSLPVTTVKFIALAKNKQVPVN
jgi:hypothetical protein